MKIEVVNINNKILEIKEPMRLDEISNDCGLNALDFVCAKVDGIIKELTYVIEKDSKIEFLGLNNPESMIIYQSGIRYVFLKALYELDSDCEVVFNYSLSRALFADLRGSRDKVNESFLKKINDKMISIIEKNIEINRIKLSIDDAHKLYSKMNSLDKLGVLKYRKEKHVNAYICGGYINYLYSYMVPSTGYLSKFKLSLLNPGIIIQFPRAELNGVIPEFINESVLAKTLIEANRWGRITKASYIADINSIVENNKIKALINLCETKHSTELSKIALTIKQDINNIKLICIAGPSSSGKTTFCNRLKVELEANAIEPVMISLDDYYRVANEYDYPFLENGKPDFEHINALDVKRINDDILRLINGETVTLPKFNFINGCSEEGKTVKLLENQPIMIEGIHALNNQLSINIPSTNKYRIFISPQAQLHIDDHNPINMTDIRLIRRIVRDIEFRNSSPEMTFDMWPSVRAGEYKWIFPYQENADFVFNSELTYELSILKKYALNALEKIDRTSSHYIIANRLIKFLKYYIEADEKWVFPNSILREFVGGS
ncbi:MAG: nucleoside kinase, partial [Anaeroplasmataceae bacterium]